ncbi:glycosyltransferase family 4 protein [Paenibacillus sp. SI8]|uniref:glycosyltransferase family 4 protein n=1 Tax=unclassified Paenibacillus TaxID=185978 RepID=UPI00346700A7
MGEERNSLFRFTILVPNVDSKNVNLKHIQLRKVGKLKGHLWEQLELPFYSRKGLLINLCNTGPIMKWKQIVTIHDVSFVINKQFYSFAFRTWYSILIGILSKFSKKIITVSNFSKQEIVKYYKVNDSKIEVTHLGNEHLHDHIADVSILKKYNLTERPYVLAVSSLNPNKNFQSIVDAVKLIKDVNFDLVIAGGSNLKVFAGEGMQLPDHFKQTGYITDGELRALYENASCFIFPSFYEGFGIPPIEAMLSGCPVIVSKVASLPEICGDSVLYCDPHKPESITSQLLSIMNDVKLRNNLIERGFKKSAEYSWDNCARSTYSIIREMY